MSAVGWLSVAGIIIAMVGAQILGGSGASLLVLGTAWFLMAISR